MLTCKDKGRKMRSDPFQRMIEQYERLDNAAGSVFEEAEQLDNLFKSMLEEGEPLVANSFEPQPQGNSNLVVSYSKSLAEGDAPLLPSQESPSSQQADAADSAAVVPCASADSPSDTTNLTLPASQTLSGPNISNPQTANTKNRYHCNYEQCPYSSNNLNIVKAHQLMHWNSDKCLFTLSECPRPDHTKKRLQSTRSQSLRWKMKRDNIKLHKDCADCHYECGECGSRHKEMSNLSNHIYEQHTNFGIIDSFNTGPLPQPIPSTSSEGTSQPEPASKLVECVVCCRPYDTRSTLMEHYKQVHNLGN